MKSTKSGRKRLSPRRAAKQSAYPRRATKKEIACVIGRVVAGLLPGELKLLTHCARCWQFRLHDWDAGRVAAWRDCLCGCLRDGHAVIARPMRVGAQR